MTHNKQAEQELIINEDNCPCGMNGDCCSNPDITGVSHECPDNDTGDICEGCYGLECRSCGNICYHEI